METTIDSKGVLHIHPKSEIESYALKKWYEENHFVCHSNSENEPDEHCFKQDNIILHSESA